MLIPWPWIYFANIVSGANPWPWSQHGSVRECLTRDWEAAGSSLTSATALCPWARHINPSLVLVQPRKTHPYITERLLMGRKESNQPTKPLTMCTYYSAESFNWYSRDLLTHSCTPESFHNLFITAANSPDKSPSSALPAKAKNCLASSWKIKSSRS